MNSERDEADRGPADADELDAPNLIVDEVNDDDWGALEEPVQDIGPEEPDAGPTANTRDDDNSEIGSGSIVAGPTTRTYASLAAFQRADSPSTPDDTPSLQNSPAPSVTERPRLHSPRPSLQPFDRRFQAKRSISGSSSLFAGSKPSPGYLTPHSRTSSVSTQAFQQEREPEAPDAPWEVVRWTRLGKVKSEVFSEAGKRKFGRVTCMAVTSTIALGTSRGVLLVFDSKQQLKAVIGEGTKALESGSITAVAISADHSTVAAGHANGSIFTWEIARPAKPFLQIPSSANAERQASGKDGHVLDVSVLHLGFLGVRHTALVSADDKGMAFSHLATRGMGALGRTVKTTRILGRYPEAEGASLRPRKPSSVLAFSPLPMGTAECGTDSMGLVAMLTPYLLVIVSTTPVAQTQHKVFRPKDIAPHSAMSGAIAWYPAMKRQTGPANGSVTAPKLAYCWSNVLTVLEVSETRPDDGDPDSLPELLFPAQSIWKGEEPIVAMQWLSMNVIAVFTISQQLIILEDPPLRATDASDLLQKHIFHVDLFSSHLGHMVEKLDDDTGNLHGVVADAFYMSFKSYKGRLFLLGFNDIAIGALSNWADRLLATMDHGDYVGAISLATNYYSGNADTASIGLPLTASDRHEVVGDKLMELMSASLRYAFGRNPDAPDRRASEEQLNELVRICFDACGILDNYDFLFDDVYSWYSQEGHYSLFFTMLQNRVLAGEVMTVPPVVLKDLVNDFAERDLNDSLEELLCRLNPQTMDFDQITKLCKGHELFDALFYVWSQGINDYTTILGDLLDAIDKGKISDDSDASLKIFTYLSYVLTGRVYPTGEILLDVEGTKAKAEIYGFLFSGSRSSEDNDRTKFQRARQLLRLHTAGFMSMLNEAFEDPFLNAADDRASDDELGFITDEQRFGLSLNRQYILTILLKCVTRQDFDTESILFLDMFIARSLPKYPQYILLPGNILHNVVVELCEFATPETADDCQLSAEYLLSAYHPPDVSSLIPVLTEARFYRVIKTIYRAEGQFDELLRACLQDQESPGGVYQCITDCLRPGAPLTDQQREAFHVVLRDNVERVVQINVRKAAATFDEYVPELHEPAFKFLEADDHALYIYLREIMEPALNEDRPRRKRDGSFENFNEKYIRLLCDFDSHHVRTYIEKLSYGDLKLESVLPALESSGMIDSAVVLLAREGQVKRGIDRLVQYLYTQGSALNSLLERIKDAPDSANVVETADDITANIDKYVHVGIWLCHRYGKANINGTNPPSAGAKTPKSRRSSRYALHDELTPVELLWLDLIDSVVQVTRSSSEMLQGDAPANEKGGLDAQTLLGRLRLVVQSTFTALLRATTSDVPAPRFLPILRAFLSRASQSSPSLTHLRGVLNAVFSAYAFEEGILGLANQLLEKDLFVDVEEVSERRKHGWRPLGLACGGCGKKLWGPGTGEGIWDEWHRRVDGPITVKNRRPQMGGSQTRTHQTNGKNQELQRAQQSEGKGKEKASDVPEQRQPESNSDGRADAPDSVVVFACRHLFHRKCLHDLLGRPGASSDEQARYICPLED